MRDKFQLKRTFPTLVLLVLGLAPAGQCWLDWVALPALGVGTACVMALLDTLGGSAPLDRQSRRAISETPAEQPALAILTGSRQ
jgi:hypothetical protein